MKKLIQFFLSCFLFFSSASCATNPNAAFCPITNEKASFWLSPKNGANYEQKLSLDVSFFTEAQENKSNFIYFIPNKAFFDDVLHTQVKKTQKILNRLVTSAKELNLKIVVELPRPSNMHLSIDQVLLSWLTVINQLKQYPDVVAYSMPPISIYQLDTGFDDHDFYKKTITEIRKIDPQTPIISKLHFSQLWEDSWFEKFAENNILYALESKIILPTICQDQSGRFPNKDTLNRREQAAKENAKNTLKDLGLWAKRQGILPQQLLISDFGSIYGQEWLKINDDLACFREIIRTNGWHWSFSYDFR